MKKALILVLLAGMTFSLRAQDEHQKGEKHDRERSEKEKLLDDLSLEELHERVLEKARNDSEEWMRKHYKEVLLDGKRYDHFPLRSNLFKYHQEMLSPFGWQIDRKDEKKKREDIRENHVQNLRNRVRSIVDHLDDDRELDSGDLKLVIEERLKKAFGEDEHDDHDQKHQSELRERELHLREAELELRERELEHQERHRELEIEARELEIKERELILKHQELQRELDLNHQERQRELEIESRKLELRHQELRIKEMELKLKDRVLEKSKKSKQKGDK